MKTYTVQLGLAAIFALAGTQSALAQFDDVYYDPSMAQETSSRSYASNEAYAENDGYDSEFIDANVVSYDNSTRDNRPITTDDYTGYEYSSRIRRFAQPYAGFGYYDPVYVDQYYYGGGIRPGVTTALIYNSPYTYSAFSANRYGAFNDPFFYSPYASARFRNRSFNNGFYDPFYDPYYGGASAFGWGATNAFGYGRGFGNSAFGYGGFGAGGFNNGFGNSAYYCPPSWGANNVAYNTPNALPARTSTVAERGNTRGAGTRGTSRPTSTDRTPVPSRTPSGNDNQSLRRPSTGRDAYSTPSRSNTTPATRSNGRVAPSRTTRPSSSSQDVQSRSSRPSYSAPSQSTSPSRSPSRPSYSAPRESSRPSYSAPSYSAPSRSSSPSYSAPSRSSSPSSSGSSRGSSGGSSSRGGGRSPR